MASASIQPDAMPASSLADALAGKATARRGPDRLREACNQFAGVAGFGQMLRQAMESSLNGELFHSPAERVFTGQLYDALMDRSSGKLGSGLGEGLYRQLSRTQGLGGGIVRA